MSTDYLTSQQDDAEEYVLDGTEQEELETCTSCSHQSDCDRRAEAEPWMYDDQFVHCLDQDRPDYRDDDYWIIKACDADQGRDLTVEEEILLREDRDTADE